MAFPITSLSKCNFEQRNLVTIERAKPGFHLHYTGGFSVEKKEYRVILPGFLEKGCTFTLVFEFLGDAANPASLFLGKVGMEASTYAQLEFSDQYGFTTRDQSRPQSVTVNSITPPVRGTHVLQYKSTGLYVQVHLDGQLVVPHDTLGNNAPEYVSFYVGHFASGYTLKTEVPVVFHELHYTMDDPGAIVKAAAVRKVPGHFAYFFMMQDVLLNVGGFVLFYGQWQPRASIKLVYSWVTVATFAAPEDGKEAILVKGYRGSFSAAAASNNTALPVVVPQAEASLRRLAISEFEKIFEYRAVTGQMMYV
ncbi:uncharacterized protein [Dermacentor albipictus]|uniref:uncharacterized protein n=1 Tax=Dermacentor albipictus TaxID=60249 RepID=UPI0038FCDD41